MEFVIAPQCRFCFKTYSEFNEPIYTVCTCEATPKYAHGSCFRDWLKIYKYSVCEVCLSKSIIVRNGYKSFKEVSKFMKQLKPFNIDENLARFSVSVVYNSNRIYLHIIIHQ